MRKLRTLFLACFYFGIGGTVVAQTASLNHFSAHARVLHHYIQKQSVSEIAQSSEKIPSKISFQLPADLIADFIITQGNVQHPAFVRVLLQAGHPNIEKDLVAIGAKVTAKMGDIWAVQVPLSSFLDFSEIEGILRVDLEQTPRPALDKARAETNADVIHAGTGLPIPLKGKDVIMGVIDGGFDALHPTFRNADRSSRVVRWWNFIDTLGTPPAGFDYGSEYTTSQQILNKATDAEDELHGTHVASICGGSGEAVTENKYLGFAPESELVWVAIPYGDRQKFFKSSTADALKYIFDYAESVHKPCVINNSFGFFFGPRDGTDLLSQACEKITGNGKIIVASAGNNGETKSYISHQFSGTGDTIITAVTPAYYNRDTIRFISGADIWATTDTTLRVGIKFWDRKNKIMLDRPTVYYSANAPTLLYNAKLPDSSKTTVEFASSGSEANLNKKQNITVKVRYYGEANFIPILNWTAQNSKTDAWAGYSYYGSEFTDQADGIKLAGYTVGDTISNMSATHCNSKSVIAVASHTLIKSFINMNGSTINIKEKVGDRANYSSRGPASDGRNKPDISAPGHWIVAAGSSFDNSLNGNLEIEEVTIWNDIYPYLALTGTSMASPVVAGTVALMLQANPNLNPNQVLEILKKTAKKDNFTGAITEKGSIEWGWGKLNALEAVKEAIIYADREDINSLKNPVIYPNPTTDGVLKIVLPTHFNGEAQVFDMTGRLIYSQKIQTDYSTETEINFPAKGIYTLKVSDDKGLYGITKIVSE